MKRVMILNESKKSYWLSCCPLTGHLSKSSFMFIGEKRSRRSKMGQEWQSVYLILANRGTWPAVSSALSHYSMPLILICYLKMITNAKDLPAI